MRRGAEGVRARRVGLVVAAIASAASAAGAEPRLLEGVDPGERPAVISGTVIGAGAEPVAGARVEVLRDAEQAVCTATTAADGTFSLPCAASGRHAVRASSGDLRPWVIEDIELEPGAIVHLNFLLLPASGATADAAAPAAAPSTHLSWWNAPVPNPVLFAWRTQPITLRMLCVAVAALSFALGAATMLALGRRVGVQRRRLSPGEIGDLVLNPPLPAVGERVTPVAVVGARGSEMRVSYGADEIATALAERRYGLVAVALIVAPALFALFSSALAVAMLAGHELVLLLALLLVPLGFLITPIGIAVQAIRQARTAPQHTP